MAPDLSAFKSHLPYDSELTGLYQPLLGWRSKFQQDRLLDGLGAMREQNLGAVLPPFTSQIQLDPATSDPREAQFRVSPAVPRGDGTVGVSSPLQSIVGQAIAARVTQGTAITGSDLRALLTTDALQSQLEQSYDAMRREAAQSMSLPAVPGAAGDPAAAGTAMGALNRVLERESRAAGALAYLGQNASEQQLADLVLRPYPPVKLPRFSWLQDLLDPAASELARAVLSPIGIVHMFRQFYFEFASFLGTPVQHVWLSPGASVELLEITTRKETVERQTEQSQDTVLKSEKSLTTQDELSDSIKQENSQNSKLGFSMNTNNSYGVGFVTGSIATNTSLDMDSSQKTAREETHKASRQQTEKVSSELRTSFKTMFRTVTETTDLNSRRYLLQNTTQNLINYELRRKMRQVGILVQDMGSFLCWQSYVDDPGLEIGVANLVHVAEPVDLSQVKDPDAVAPPAEYSDAAISLSWTWTAEDKPWVGGIRPFLHQQLLPKPGYVYSRSEIKIVKGPSWGFEVWPPMPHPVPDSRAVAHIDGAPPPLAIAYVDIPAPGGGTERSVTAVDVGLSVMDGMRDDRQYDWDLELTIYYAPSQQLLADAATVAQKALDQTTEERRRLFSDGLFKTAQERVKAASNIAPRAFEDLREEERVVVYRSLVRQLLAVAGVTDEDHRVRHVFSELVQSMFDIDGMLYFVAPEWWLPRKVGVRGPGSQQLNVEGLDVTELAHSSLVSWGGDSPARADSYYITEDSTPARLGSSLGWVLQLDGDAMRDAFLNAPWVKAVVPIRPMMEWRALDWLSSPQIEGADGLNELYDAKDDAERSRIVQGLREHSWDDASLTARYASLGSGEITLFDALRFLVVKLQAKQQAAAVKVTDPNDPTIGYLPLDRVYEHGFDPLPGGFKADPGEPFEVFDQWVTVVPTDQIVPVEVSYDPKTGLMI